MSPFLPNFVETDNTTDGKQQQQQQQLHLDNSIEGILGNGIQLTVSECNYTDGLKNVPQQRNFSKEATRVTRVLRLIIVEQRDAWMHRST
jgi:hypothetical protein